MFRFIRIRFGVLIVCVTAAFSVLVLAPSASAAKPAPPPPTPTCNAPGSMVPSIAFAYSYKLYVGNADGTCAIQLAAVAQYYHLAFTFNGSKYRLFWVADTRDEVKLIRRQQWTVKMVEFTVGPTGGINEQLPLPVRELYRDAVTTSESTLSSVSANKAGDQIIFARTQGATTEIKRIDFLACNPGCPAPATIITPNSSLALEFSRAGDNRIYVKQTLTGGGQVVAFYEDVAGSGWLGPRVVASTSDAVYSDRGVVYFGGVRMAHQDWDSDLVKDDLLAVPWTTQGTDTALRIDVLKIDPGCTVYGAGSCLSDGTASVVSPAPGLNAYVHWYDIGWEDDALLRVDDTSGTPVIESFNPHDGSALVSHGPGVYPAGLKQ
jgi:hypothetical protein